MIRVVGAYAAAPEPPAERRAFYSELWADSRVDGFEAPFGPPGSRWSSDWLWADAPPGCRHVLTLLPATMEAIAHDPDFGLSSAVERGRQGALRLADTARRLVVDVNSGGRHQLIRAVEIPSAPAGAATPQRRMALARSLEEISGWDWAGAVVVLEHCDAARPDGHHEKGFLPLADEISAMAAMAAPKNGWGIALNWGRSAIEARSPDVLEQVICARDTGLLRGLLFSGACDRDSPFGPAWADAHAGIRAEPGMGAPASLLTRARLAAARRAAGSGLAFDGVKVGVRPAGASLDQRLATVRAALSALDDAWPR
ncbi:DUF4862 family protein [Propionicimonas sp.]|uniref:DUF4862 family protein n=1 Tax=Propionicimonas sp. TaxID=1955623 RepID=UPI0039E2AD1E